MTASLKTLYLGMAIGSLLLVSCTKPAETEKAAEAEKVSLQDQVNGTAPTATAATDAAGQPAPGAPVSPYRTFVTFQRYNMESNGDASRPISNVKIEVSFADGNKFELPEGGQYWPIGNGQVQEINRTFELPWSRIQKDGFKFQVQMIRKGAKMLPCVFEVQELSQFNRAYICKTDTGYQASAKIPPEKQDIEGIQVRVFTDRNSEKNEIPNNAIALK